MLAAGRRDDFLAPVIRIEVHVVPVRDRIAQLGCARHGRVLGEIPLNRRDGRVFDVLRRRKMRLACAKIDDVDSLRPKLVGLGHHRHRG